MYRTVWGLFLYCWAGAFVFGGMDSPANKARSMSAGLLIFYLIPLAVMYSATNASRFDENRRCQNGHRVSQIASFCEDCGAPVGTSTRESQQETPLN
jgi:hypothetical protein